MKKRLIQTNERIEEMIAELNEKNGYMSDSECIRQAIIAFHTKNFPNYVKETRQPQSAEERERKRIERLDAERVARMNMGIDRGKEICEKLGGEVVETGRNMYACVYPEYAFLNKHEVDVREQQIPLENLDEDNIINQYRYANKDTILAILADKEKNI